MVEKPIAAHKADAQRLNDAHRQHPGVVFGGMFVSIWLSYLFFMRGNTDKEKVAALLPKDFKPDWQYRGGDTYVGYENGTKRLALVDWPIAKMVTADNVRSIEPMDQSIVGLKHRWIVLSVDDPKNPPIIRL